MKTQKRVAAAHCAQGASPHAVLVFDRVGFFNDGL